MKFLLDQDVPEDVTFSLKALGHKVLLLRQVLPVTATDDQVLTYAVQEGLVLLTCNRDDFIELAKSRQHHGIIILVRRKTRVAERAALVDLLDKAGETGLLGNINFA